MTGRSKILVLLAGLVTTIAQAQDMDIVSQRDIQGTARYTAMAGAMTAVGGDPSAVQDNPAGLGVYRRSEVTFTMDMLMNRFHQHEYPAYVSKVNNFTVPQAAFVFSFGSYGKERGLLYSNFMLSFHQLARFSRTYSAVSTQPVPSLAEVIANKTDGLSEDAVQAAGRWDDPEIGWLSCQGYDTYLIDPLRDNKWGSVTRGGLVNNDIMVQESGYANAYSFSWGGNINNQLYIGATLNILSYYHNQTTRYREALSEDCGIRNDTYVSQSAIGVNGVFGLLYRPLDWLRIGASFQTPGALSTTTTNYGTLSSTLYINDTLRTLYSPEQAMQNSARESYYRFPLRASGGVAFQFLRYGLISLQYDYAHSAYMQDVHTLKVGLEGVICHNYFINAGYAYESMFKTVKPQELSYNTVRTDTHSQYMRDSHYGSIGFGFRNNLVIAQVAYQLRALQMDVFAHELCQTPYDIRALNHRVTFTLGFHW